MASKGAPIEGGIRIEGLKDRVRDLEKAGIEIADLKAAFAGFAAQAAALAASFAPHRSGRLAASIKGNKAKNYATVKAGSARVPYAGPINYGWAARSIQPSNFMQRADEAMRPHIQDDLEAAIDRLIATKGLK